MLRVLCEVSEDRPIPSLFVRGLDLLDPENVRVAHRSREVGGDGRITDGQVNVPPAGGAR